MKARNETTEMEQMPEEKERQKEESQELEVYCSGRNGTTAEYHILSHCSSNQMNKPLITLNSKCIGVWELLAITQRHFLFC
jgi:hypothetical protein